MSQDIESNRDEHYTEIVEDPETGEKYLVNTMYGENFPQEDETFVIQQPLPDLLESQEITLNREIQTDGGQTLGNDPLIRQVYQLEALYRLDRSFTEYEKQHSKLLKDVRSCENGETLVQVVKTLEQKQFQKTRNILNRKGDTE